MAVSEYDKQHLSKAQQDTIAAVTQAAQSGSMSWAEAHSAAEAIRAQAGYSGGQSGNEYNQLSSGSGNGMGTTPGSTGSNGSNANPFAGTNFHQDANDYALKYASSGNYDDWQAVLDALAARWEKISATGNDYGITNAEILESLLGYQMAGDNRYYQNQAMQMLQQLQMQTPRFSGSWGDRMSEKLLKQAIAMNYEDWTQSDQYKALADRYGIQGEMTMQDVLGQISSRTGGLASSYAATAAQQQYNDYMAQLEEVARQMFADERSDVIENAQLAREYGQQEYQRYLDQLNLQNNRNSTALGIINQMMGYTSDQLNNKYAQDQNSKAEAQDRINAYLAAYGNLADLDPTLIETSGYTTAELNALEKLYAGQNGAMNDAQPAPIWDYPPKEPEEEPKPTGTPSSSYGTSFNTAWSQARNMSDNKKSDEEIMAYLDRFSEERLTEEGLRYIMNSLNLGGYRE